MVDALYGFRILQIMHSNWQLGQFYVLICAECYQEDASIAEIY